MLNKPEIAILAIVTLILSITPSTYAIRRKYFSEEGQKSILDSVFNFAGIAIVSLFALIFFYSSKLDIFSEIGISNYDVLLQRLVEISLFICGLSSSLLSANNLINYFIGGKTMNKNK